MANFYGKDRNVDFAASKLMSFGKSFSRMNGQPLDESEVWYNKTALEAFAAGNSAYVGMKLVYVDETNQKVYQYSVQYDGTVKEIGVAPLGDTKSIEVDTETGTVSLKGISSLVFERDILGEDDQPTGEKEAVQYQPLMTAAGLIWVEPSKTTVEGLATLIDALTVRVKDLEDKEDKDTTYSVKENELALKLEGTEFSTVLKIVHKDNKIQLLGINDAVISEFDASEFVADGVLENAEYDAETKELVFTWNIVTGEDEEGNKIYKTDRVNVGDLVDTYTAGNGITIENNVISAKVADNDKYLTVDDIGIHTKGIDGAIAEAEERAAQDATDKADDAKQAAIDDAAGKYATIAQFNTVSNTASDAQNRVGIVEEKIDEITSVGGEPNVLERIKVNGVTQSVTNKEVNITVPTNVSDLTNDKGFLTNIKVPETVTDGEGDVTYQSLIQIVNGSDNTVKVIDDSGVQAAIQNIQNNSITGVKLADTLFTINNHIAEITKDNAYNALGLGTAATKNIGDFDAAGAAGNVLGTSNDGADAKTVYGAIALANSILGKSTDAAGVATVHGALNEIKTRYTNDEILAILGQGFDSENTVKDFINQLVNGVSTTANSAVEQAATNKQNIEAIYKAADDSGNPASGLLVDEIARATAAEQANKALIDTLTEQIGNVSNIMNFVGVSSTNPITVGETLGVVTIDGSVYNDPKDGDVIIYGEKEYVYSNSVWVEFGDATGNAAAITALEKAVNETLPDAITKALADAKEYTDDSLVLANITTTVIDEVETKTANKGLILPEVDKFEMTDGKVTAISTDLLKNGSMTLILYGGTAKG